MRAGRRIFGERVLCQAGTRAGRVCLAAALAAALAERREEVNAVVQ
jgi:hypothetical protein